jgi:hypothetical protein
LHDDETAFSKRRGWKYLEEKAASRQPDDRRVALVRGYAWLEHALAAVGLTRSQGSTRERIKQAHNKGYFKLPAYLIDNEVADPLTLIARSIQVRHAMSHVDTVPRASECRLAVRVYGDVWQGLRRQFVTLPRARNIALTLLGLEHVKTVAIYGSAARGKDDPGRRTSEVLKSLSLSDRTMHASLLQAASCRWLDLLLLDGTRFGLDVKYTLEVRDHQADHFFFDNLSHDVRVFQLASGDFDGPPIPFFAVIRKWCARVKRALNLTADSPSNRSYSTLEIALTESAVK